MSLVIDKVHAGDELPELSYDVTATTVVLGALAARDWRPMHHDHDFAVNRNGTKDIFLNTPNQAGWIERYLTDWTGSNGRLGKVRFKMKASVCAGDVLTFNATVTDKSKDAAGIGWIDLDVRLSVGDVLATECTARIAVPTSSEDDPWQRRGDDWRP